MNDYKAPDPDCVFIGLGIGVSPEIPEQSEDLFINGVMKHHKRDVIIEILGRVYQKLINLKPPKNRKATKFFGVPEELLPVARKLIEEHNKKIDDDESEGNIAKHPFEDQLKR